jgi:hypothetical protein
MKASVHALFETTGAGDNGTERPDVSEDGGEPTQVKMHTFPRKTLKARDRAETGGI